MQSSWSWCWSSLRSPVGAGGSTCRSASAPSTTAPSRAPTVGARRNGICAREERHDELDLRPLSDASRPRYTQQWQEMQSGFVDRPQVAVADADRLVTDLMRERGYPVDDTASRN